MGHSVNPYPINTSTISVSLCLHALIMNLAQLCMTAEKPSYTISYSFKHLRLKGVYTVKSFVHEIVLLKSQTWHCLSQAWKLWSASQVQVPSFKHMPLME